MRLRANSSYNYINIIILFLFLFGPIICVHILQLNENNDNVNMNIQSNQLTYQQLINDPFIQLSVTESLINIQDQQSTQLKNLQFFILKSVSRHKNKAYLKLLKNYQKLVLLLIQKLIIGDQKLLIKSKIKQKYLRKKRVWQFGFMFMIQGEKSSQLQNWLDEFQQKKSVIRLNMNINTKLDNIKDRIIAGNMYIRMKNKVKEEIQKFTDLEIVKVQKFQLKGINVVNTIKLEKKIIEKNLEKLYNNVQDVNNANNNNNHHNNINQNMAHNNNNNNQQQISHPADFFFLKSQILQQSKNITMKVVFKVGQQVQSQQSSEVQSQSSQFQQEEQDDDSSDDEQDQEDYDKCGENKRCREDQL